MSGGEATSARPRLGVLISGRGSNMRALLEAAADPSFPADVAVVLSNRPDAAGLERAAEAGVTTEVVDHRPFKGDRPAFEAEVDARLRAHGVTLVCLAGFMRLLSPWFVGQWHNRMINIHPSLLPSFKGLDTHQRVLDAGGRLHGCTVHYVRAEMDDGPILVQAAVPVLPGDDADALAHRVLAQEHRIYPLAVRLIAEGRAVIEGERVILRDCPTDGASALISPVG